MVGTWIFADCPLFMPRQFAQKPPSPPSRQCSREPWPPVRVGMRWNHLPSFFYVFLIDCVYWDVFLWGFGSFYPGSHALSSILHIELSCGFMLLLCSPLTKASCLTVHIHTVTGKILCRKPPTSLFTFCPAI